MLDSRSKGLFWSLAYCPFGIITGFFSVTFVFKMSHDGLTASQIALLLAAPSLSNWLRWIWAPLVDAARRLRTIYFSANTVALVGLILCLLEPADANQLTKLVIIVFIANFCNTLTGMVVEASVAKISSRTAMKSSCAWMQAGGLIGSGVGGALGLIALTKFEAHPLFAGLLLVSVSLTSSMALLFIPSQASENLRVAKSFPSTLAEIAREVRKVVASPSGTLVAILCILPLGTGVAQGILTQAKVAGQWHVNAAQVAVIQGLFAGLLTPFGSILSAKLFQRYKPAHVYAFSGLMLAVVTWCMSASPFNAINYCAFNLAYAFVMGLGYGAFSAMIISLVEKRSAASGYNVFASFANFPVWTMNLLLAWALDHYSVTTMLITESIFGVASFLIFYVAHLNLESAKHFSDARLSKNA